MNPRATSREQLPALERGVTLIELMVALAVLAILLGIAVPSVHSMIKGQRTRSVASDLYATMIYARSEAMKRSSQVIVGPNDGGDDTWAECGWRVTTSPAPAAFAACPPVPGSFNDADHQAAHLRMRDAAPNITITTTPAVATVTYNSSGRPATGSLTCFMIRHAGEVQPNYAVRIDMSGRPIVCTADVPNNMLRCLDRTFNLTSTCGS